jgi:ribonucleoside-diphosphate reductase alpha chain
MITVIKRNGRTEPLDITKIQKYTSVAVKNLSGVSQSELEVDAQIQFRDGITSSEIQKTLIKTAVDKIDIDAPNWTFVASKLFLFNLYHQVNGFTGYSSLEEYFIKGEKEGRLLLGLRDMYDIQRLEKHIKPERDMLFNYLGVKTLYDRYLIKDKHANPIELPQHMFMAIAMFLAQREEKKNEWAIKFYDMISQFQVMLATPTLSNARTTRHQLSSCYIGSTPDNIEGIFDSYQEMAMLSKFGGGIGWDWTGIRSMGSFIDGHKNAAGGTVPFLKITNDIAIAVDQLGTRKGAIAIYMEPWHIDINDFLDLKKNSGEERRRAHDLFPAMWLNDLFMERVQEDAIWTLFDPYDVRELATLYGEDFNKRYKEFEEDESIIKEKIKAKNLWKKILTSYFETGSPFLCFKDNANRANPNKHTGVIRSSNLCTEIFQNTKPNHYKIKFIFENGDSISYEEDEMVRVDSGLTKLAKKVTALDSLGGMPIYVVEKEKINGDTAVCNLASVNLSKINTKEEIDRIVPIAVRCLDNVIDLNFYPIEKVKRTNMKSRSIGLGVMGEAQMLAEAGITWGSQQHFDRIDEVMEAISFNTISASCDLALEKGVYEWESLRTKVKNQGMRNGYLMAIAPTSSISILTGTTQAIEPVFKRKWFEENLSGLIPVVVPKLSPDTWAYYTPAYDLNQTVLIKAAAIRQKWLDQGQSLNIFITLDKASGRYLNEIYMLAWKLGLKSTYYLRSQSPEVDGDVEDRSMECVGCQ